MSRFISLSRSAIRRFFVAARWIDRRNPRWLAWLSPQRKRRWFAKLWRPLLEHLPEVNSFSGLELRIPRSMLTAYVIQPYEASTARLIESLLQPGQVAIDVGANIGYLTALMARAVGPDGHVWAVEPDPKNLEFLTENVARNGFGDRVSIIAAAAVAQKGVRHLQQQEMSARNSLFATPGRQTVSVEVNAVRLDEEITGTVHLIKMDVEGAELEALAGLGQILVNEPRPQLLVEWCPQHAERAGVGAADLPAFLQQMGYETTLLPECPGPEDLAGAMALASAGKLRDGWYANLHATPLPLGE